MTRDALQRTEKVNSNMAYWSPPRSLPFLVLPFCTGVFFASRTIYVFVTARWLNVGTEPGVVVGFLIATILGLAAAFNALGMQTREEAWILQNRSIEWVLLYLVYAGMSLAWSAATSVASSSMYWCALAGDVAIVLLLIRGSRGEGAVHSLLKGFIAGSCVLAAIAWMMPVAADLRLGDIDYFNTNQIGNLCALSLLACSLLSSRGDAVFRIVPWLLGLTLIRSLSKSTIVAFLCCLLYRLVRDNGISRARKWLYAVVLSLLGFGFVGLFSAYYDVYTMAGNQAETLTGRTAIWAWTLDAALSRPWFGNGFDAMWKVAPAFGGDLFEARHAENELLQQFFAYGACGVVLLAGIYGSLWASFRGLARTSERAALVAFLVYVLVRGLAEAEPFDLLLPLWLVTALAFLATRQEQALVSLSFRSSASADPKASPAH